MALTVELFDSTLRDGAQGEGVSFSVEDKLGIVKALDELGVPYIEAGNPGSNPKDLEFFERAHQLDLKHAQLVAFGSTRRKNCNAAEDTNLEALINAGTKAVAVFGKCWFLHVKEILSTTAEENFRMISDTCRYLKEQGKTVFFDAEHFFDGYKDDPQFAMKALEAAEKAGASRLVLCDTNGGCLPNEIDEIVKEVCKRFPGKVGIHTHNDRGWRLPIPSWLFRRAPCRCRGLFWALGSAAATRTSPPLSRTSSLPAGLRAFRRQISRV